MNPAVDLIIPVYEEGENIERVLEEIRRTVSTSHRILIVYDFDEDSTLPVVRRLQPDYPNLHTVRNEMGPGVLNAIRTGFAAASAEVVIVTMGDLSDDVAKIDEMARLILRDGYDVVCASRYVRGGRQIGGPVLKRAMSRAAGVSLHAITGIPTHDVTNAFRAWRKSVLDQIEIESRAGFEYCMELTVKAWLRGFRVTEIPATWRDRSAGKSRFRLWQWIPHYLRWYLHAILGRFRIAGRAV